MIRSAYIVFYKNRTGTCTMQNTVFTVTGHDALASLFAGRNIAYVSYSTRGVTDSDDPPDMLLSE